MTEQEWLECEDPTPMLEFLRGKASNRKNRLFACACGRQHLLSPGQIDDRSRQALEFAERFADGLVAEMEYLAACQKAQEAVIDSVRQQDFEKAAWARDIRVAAEYGASVTIIARNIGNRELACSRIHDIFGNPFRPVAVDSAWLTPVVVEQAQAIYDERAFDRLPILADTLEEVGCNNADILTHCREPGEHVRGCWPVDLCLGKS